jgi:uncharacterized protein
MRGPVCLLVCAALIGACTDAPISPSVQTGISGTLLEAQKVVQLVYGQEPEAAIAQLPYSGGNIAPAVRRMRERWPQLKPYLDSGAVGLGSRGLLALREPGAAAPPELAGLLRSENNDRTVLYVASSGDVGHGDDRIDNWSPTTELVFAQAWAAQAPSGWWVQDSRGRWLRKPAAASR